MKSSLVLAFLLLATGPGFAQEAAVARFSDTTGAMNGEANLVATPAGVLISVAVKGLPAGRWVAFHVHEAGSCDAMAHFDSAGGHFNPAGARHGFLASGGPHAGDMPNQLVGPDGTLRAQVLNAMVSLDGSENAIRGRALMIHAGEDDYTSQPAGNAGIRLACAVIE
ncbi:MAG: superoxide dismutase family protein [Rhizobiales bacterium]|nr:superoxide dismutase family protein [Hyphomicrobiales bacterium]